MKTPKLLTLLGISRLICFANPVYAQPENATPMTQPATEAFSKGSNVLGVGFGLGGYYTYYGAGYASTPNFVLSYDNGTFGNVGPGTISLGGLLSYKGISYSYTDYHTGYYYNQNWNYYIVGLRGAYHLTIHSAPKFDPYAGLMLGYYDISYKETSNDPEFNVPGSPYYFYYANNYSSYMAFSLFIGARYYVSPHLGLWLELGYGYSDAALGLCYKM